MSWAVDIPASPILKSLSGVTIEVFKLIFDNPEKFMWILMFIILMFVLSFVIPCINLLEWIIRRAMVPENILFKDWKSNREPLLPTKTTDTYNDASFARTYIRFLTPAEIEDIKRKFYRIDSFPDVIGAIDCNVIAYFLAIRLPYCSAVH